MFDDDDNDRLTGLIPWLREQGYAVELKYRDVRERAQDGAIPGTYQRNGLWRFNRRNTAAIADALRLKRIPTPPAGRSVRQAA